MEVVEETAANKEQTQILKGKRTKRLRPQSPIPFSIVPPVSTFTDAQETLRIDSKDKNLNMEGEDITSNSNNNNNNNNVVCVTNGVTSSSSASSSSNNVALNNNNNKNNLDMSTTDKEDQDMAHCLILLAQGHSLVHHSHNHNHNQHPQQPQPLTIYNETLGNNNNNNAYRFSSRRFLETSSSNVTNGGGKAGYYVYQCKTCDRTFPSFQALGGHRASHKKPKAIQADEFKKNINEQSCRYNAIPLQSSNINNNNRGLVVYGKSGNKVHECGICGAEFTSGQALGGHMRRHRGAVVAAAAAAAANTALSLSPMSYDQSDGQDHPAKRARSAVVSLDLDLNLPAPEDENRVNGSGIASKQEDKPEDEQQPQPQPQQLPQIQKQREELKSPLVLSAPTLVDCHY